MKLFYQFLSRLKQRFSKQLPSTIVRSGVPAEEVKYKSGQYTFEKLSLIQKMRAFFKRWIGL